MAPEQARGEVDRVDERADVFALGSILCEVLTGQPAFLGRSSGEILRKAALGDTGRRPGPARRLRGRRRTGRHRAGLPGARGGGPPAARRRRGRAGDGLPGRRAGPPPRRRAGPRRRGGPCRGGRRTAAVATSGRVDARRFQVGLAASLLVLTTAGGLTFTYLLQRASSALRGSPGCSARRRRCGIRPAGRPVIPASWRDGPGGAGAGRGPGAGGGRGPARRDPDRAGARPMRTPGCGRSWSISGPISRTSAPRAPTPPMPPRSATPGWTSTPSSRPSSPVGWGAGPRRWSSSCRPSSTTGRPCAAWPGVRPPPGGSRWRRRGWPTRTRIATACADPPGRRPHAAGREALKALAAAPEAAELPAPTAVLLGKTLADVGQAEAAVSLLRAAAGRHPGDVWVNYALAGALDELRPRPARRRCGTTRRPAPSAPRRRTSWPTCSSGWAAAPRPRRSSATWR